MMAHYITVNDGVCSVIPKGSIYYITPKDDVLYSIK